MAKSRKGQRQYQTEFQGKGFTLSKFMESDTRRIGSEGEVFKYYAAMDDRLIEKFEGIKDAGQWIEFK